jgi:hypothetical protein
LIQQCGGKLFYKHIEVRALRMEDTGGYDLDEKILVQYGAEQITITELLKR